MKKLVIASFIAALPISAGAADLSDSYVFIEESVQAAPPSVVGHLELAAGWWHREQLESAGTVTEDRLLLEGYGRVNIPFAGNWNLELDTGATYGFRDEPQDDQLHVGGVAHLWADLGGLRLGAFGGGFYLWNASDVSLWVAGAEAEVDVGNNLTLGVQGSYSGPDGCGACDFVYVVGWADFYPTPNTKLGVQGGWYDFVDHDISALEFWNVSAIAEHRFAGTPLSLFVGAGYDANFDQSFEIVKVAGGLRIFFDDNALTLREHDRQVPFEYWLPGFSNNLGL